MRAVAFHAHGGPEQLRLCEWPEPELCAGEALVAVRAVALNGFDPMILGRTTSLRTPLPMIPCGDASGEIIELHPRGTDGWRVGERVSLVPFGDFGMLGETALGAARERLAIGVGNLVRMPQGVSFIAAAALPVAYGTAYRMMHGRGRVQPGERVLILGAGGGVGTCCVQLAKAAGAEVIACASGEWKLERLRALGADHLIDSATGDWVEAVRGRFGRPRVAGGGGVDVIVNYVGGESWNASLKVLGRGGRLLVCGASAGHRVETDLRYLWSFEHTIVGSDGWTPDDQARLLAMVAERRLEPIIHAVRPFSAAAEAVRELIERRVFGKSVLVPEDGEASGGAGGLPDA